MTYPDFNRNNFQRTVRSKSLADIGITVKGILTDSLVTGHVTYGVYACINLLSSNPENVSLCILPDVNTCEDPSIRIQHKLIDAHCRENHIPILQVDSVDKLKVLLQIDTDFDDHDIEDQGDLSCVLIEHSQSSTKEEMINKIYNKLLNRPMIVDLPV